MVLTISNQDVSYQVSEDAMQQAARIFNQPMPAISGGKLLMTVSFEDYFCFTTTKSVEEKDKMK